MANPEERGPLDALAKSRQAGESILDDLSEQLDRTRRLLTSSPDAAAEAALSRFAGEAEVEARIAADLASIGTLAAPERFDEAHRLAMRALEVLDREGFRDPPVSSRYGPLRPLARIGAEFVARYIVKGYASDSVDSLRRLYARREAQSPVGTPERQVLARARVETDRLAAGFTGGGIGAPALVVGGAAVPVLASASQYFGAVDFLSRPVLLSGFLVMFVLFGLLSSILFAGSAVAHRRCRLIMRQPLAALWEVIGHAGEPPTDNSRLFAALAILLSAVVWVVLPAAGIAAYVFS